MHRRAAQMYARAVKRGRGMRERMMMSGREAMTKGVRRDISTLTEDSCQVRGEQEVIHGT